MKSVYYIVIINIIVNFPVLALSETLLYDNFEDYRPGSGAYPMWIPESGDWTVTDKGFQGTNCKGYYIAQGAKTGSAAWTDYTISLRMKLVSRGNDWRDGPWIGFRYKDSYNAYTLGFYNQVTALHKVSNGKMTDDKTVMASTNKTITDNEWHYVVITISGNTITVNLDGNSILSVIDKGWNDSPPLLSGGIVLSARKYKESEGTTKVVFNDVKVEAIGEITEDIKQAKKNVGKEAYWISQINNNISVLDFIKTRLNRRWTRTPRKVLAFYYPWYGRPEVNGRWIHWAGVNFDEHNIANSTHYPAIGPYDSHDLKTIDYHIQLAKEHGVDAFICSWWGQDKFEDKALIEVLDRANEHNFEVSIYWETVLGKGNDKVALAVNDLVYVLEKYGSHPAFLKIDGKPVIFIYRRVMDQINFDEWPAIITTVQKRYDNEFILITDRYQESSARLFDGIHTYNFCNWMPGKNAEELRRISTEYFTRAVDVAKSRAKISCITVIPGYDDTKTRSPGINVDRMDGDTYRMLWDVAIKADPDWIVITSWNEWHEGSEIEPSREHGDKYLKLTSKYAERFKQEQYSNFKVPESPPIVCPEKASSLRKIYKDITVAVLPGYNSDAPFWLAETGVHLKEFTWDEVIDAGVLNVRDFPLLIYACGERYTQTLNKQGDVDEAILKYLREGGLLLVIPSKPFPFYKNESGEVVSSAGKFGIPIEGSESMGWESPPANAKLTFKIDKKVLAGLPSSVSFSESGDLRWRPCTGEALDAGDVYLPIAQLEDEERNRYGDGIVYISHVVSEPKNGRCIYVWMRMLDIFDKDNFLFDLFSFAREKITAEQ
jgi:hypothetical protein